jgi:hypothetical protein
VLRYSAILLAAVTLAAASALGAQDVTKPRSTTTTYRLPKPASVTAAQQPNGRIRVVWSAVDGAVRYQLYRSVPPVAASTVTLPNPSDTQYVDTDVKAGSTYYYVVSAVNEAGTPGLKAGTTPVTATAVAVASADTTPAHSASTDTASTTTAATDTTPTNTTPADTTPTNTAPADSAPTQAPVAPPTNVQLKLFDYLHPQVTWQTSIPGARVEIERWEDDGTNPDNVTWRPAVPLSDNSWPCSTTCRFVESRTPNRNAMVRYRLTIVEPAPSTRRSEPVTTSSVSLDLLRTATEIHEAWLVKGQTTQLAGSAPGMQYSSLDSNTVSLWSPGVVKAKEYGKTYVTATGLSSDGTFRIWIWRVWVGDAPQ